MPPPNALARRVATVAGLLGVLLCALVPLLNPELYPGVLPAGVGAVGPEFR